MRENKFILAALVLAIITGLLCFQFLKSQSQREYVIVAKTSIPRQTRIDSSMLELRPLHPDSVHSNAIKNIQEIVGNFALMDIFQGEQVLLGKVSGNDEYKDFAGRLSPNQRGIFIPLSLKYNLGGAVARDDLVDVIYVANDRQLGFSVAKTILQRVLVLDVRSENGQSLAEDDRSVAGGIIVAVDVHDSEKIAYCLENGQLYISRQPYGGNKVNTEGVFYENIYRD